MAPDDKEQARGEHHRGAAAPTTGRGTTVSVRINGLDTHWCYRDVVDVVEARGEVLDTVLVPKVGSPSDVEFVATLLDQIEQRNGWEPGRIGIHILIETAAGMANVEAISRARPDRLEAMVFGVADYAASVRARTTNIGGANPDYSVLTDPDRRRARARSTGATSGTSGSAGWWRRAAPRACARSTVRSATSTTPDGYRSAAPPRRGAGVRGQVGDPPVAGRAGERGLLPVRGRGRPRAADPAGHGGRGEGGQGRRLARRTADRRRVDPHGREPDAPGRADCRSAPR